MSGKEIENGAVCRFFCNSSPQPIWRKPCQIKEALGSVTIRQDPAERHERQLRIVLRILLRGVTNCHCP